jgi:hypothetical protein
MPPSPAVNRTLGWLLTLLLSLVILSDWWLGRSIIWLIIPPFLLIVALLFWQVTWPRRAFVLVAGVLTLISVIRNDDWMATVEQGVATAAFIAAFFTALTSLRHAAETSPDIRACGRFLSQQPPGRRYAALTAGGHLFALLLNYGSIALLGSLAVANAKEEPDPEIRHHRTRRMLLAIQRGFLSSLPWSPLSFAMAISLALVPQATWSGAVLPAIGNVLILAGVGWSLDTIFKPRLKTRAAPRRTPEGGWSTVLPLLKLLAVLGVLTLALHLLTGIRVVGLVMVVVPLIALGWTALQARQDPTLAAPLTRARQYFTGNLPNYRAELILLMMAGYIGTVGARLLAPLVEGAGLDLTQVPIWVLLVSFVWIIPLTGQLGMNPILTVSMIAPLLPDAASLEVTPTALIVAITAGWSLSGASSPYTATTMLIGSYGGLSARRVGLVWNGGYTLASALVLSGWVLLFGLYLGQP